MVVIITLFRLIEVNEVSEMKQSGDVLIPEGWPEYESSVQLEDASFTLGVRFVPHKHRKSDLFVRPRDFEQARNWLFDTHSISKTDKYGIFDMLNAMEDDQSLYLSFSWFVR